MSELSKFLESMKRSARMQKNKNNGKVTDYTRLPLQDRFSFNTGLGEDDKFQPSNPTHLLMTNQGARTIHEKEQVNIGPGGNFQVIPAEEMGGQAMLSRHERHMQIPGYQFGTGRHGAIPMQKPPRTDYGINTGGDNTAVGSLGKTPPTDMRTSTGLTAEDMAKHDEEERLRLQTEGWKQGEAEQQAASMTDEERLAAQIEGWKEGEAEQQAAAGRITPPEPLPKEQPTQADIAQTKALGRLTELMEGGSEALNAYWQRHLDDLAATHGTEEAVFRQQLAQGRVPEGEAAARLMMLRRSQGVEMSQAQATAAVEKMKQQENAALELHNAALAAQEREFRIDERDWNRKMDAIETMSAAGDWTGVEAELEKIFPDMDFDFSKVVTEEKGANFAKGLRNITSYIASGLSADDALKAMKADGTFDLLGMEESDVLDLYGKMELGTDPVYRAMYALDDSSVESMFPDLYKSKLEEGMTPADAVKEIRGLIGRLHLFGAMTFDENGKLVVDYDLLQDIVGKPGAKNGGEGATYADYRDSALAQGVAPDKIPTEAEWKEKGQPKYYGGREPISQDQINSMIDSLGITGVPPERVKQYLEAHEGVMPDNIATFTQWNTRNPDPMRIEAYIAGKNYGDAPVERLYDADLKMLKEIRQAKGVPANKRSDRQKELAGMLPGVSFAGGKWGDPDYISNWDKNQEWIGYSREKIDGKKSGYLSFNLNFKQWANNNRGNVFEYKGELYKIDPAQATKRQKLADAQFYVDTVYVTRLSDGAKGQLNPSAPNYGDTFYPD